MKKKILKQYTIQVSDEGKQYDNFIGYYTVIAKNKKHALKLIKKSTAVPEYVKNSAKFTFVRLLTMTKDFNLPDCFTVSEIISDSYN